MQIKITACCGVHGEIVEPGEILDVDDPTGKMLVGIGKAIVFEEEVEVSPPTQKDLDDMKAGELVAYAVANSLDIGGLQPQAGREKVLAAVRTAIQNQDPAIMHRDPGQA